MLPKKVEAPELGLALYRAQAIAGLGRVDEAIQTFRRFESDPKMPHWTYLVHIGMIYSAAREFDKSLAVLEEAIREGPSSGILYFSLAELRILRKHDAAGARAAMAKAESFEVPDLARPYVPLYNGLIELESTHYEEARRLLQEALDMFKRLTRHSMISATIRMTKAFLCIACAKCGQKDVAQRYLNEVRNYLQAIGEDDWLQRCEQAVLESGKSS